MLVEKGRWHSLKSVGGIYYSSRLTVMSMWVCVSLLLQLEHILLISRANTSPAGRKDAIHMQETGSHSTVKLVMTRQYTPLIWVHAPRSWYHFQISAAVSTNTFPSFHSGCSTGLNSEMKILWLLHLAVWTETQIILFFFLLHYRHSNTTHMFMCIHLFQPRHINDKIKETKKKS